MQPMSKVTTQIYSSAIHRNNLLDTKLPKSIFDGEYRRNRFHIKPILGKILRKHWNCLDPG